MSKKRTKDSLVRWALLWSDREFSPRIIRHHFEFENCLPKFFITREEARGYAKENYGYMSSRKDLRTYPHYWRMPNAIKVNISIEEI